MLLKGRFFQLKPVFIVLLAIAIAQFTFFLNHQLSHFVVMKSEFIFDLYRYDFLPYRLLELLKQGTPWLRGFLHFFDWFNQYFICALILGFGVSRLFYCRLFARAFIWVLVTQIVIVYALSLYQLQLPLAEQGSLSYAQRVYYRFDHLIMQIAEILALISACLLCFWLRTSKGQPENEKSIIRSFCWLIGGFILSYVLLLAHITFINTLIAVLLHNMASILVAPLALNTWLGFTSDTAIASGFLVSSIVSSTIIGLLVTNLSSNITFFRGYAWGCLIHFFQLCWEFMPGDNIDADKLPEVQQAVFDVFLSFSELCLPLFLCSVFFWYSTRKNVS